MICTMSHDCDHKAEQCSKRLINTYKENVII